MIDPTSADATVPVVALRRQHREAGDGLEIAAARRLVAGTLFAGLDTPPATVGRYVLRRRLGAGGMGIVFAAHDPRLEREVAIKLLHPAAAPEGDQLLLEEAQNTAQLVHPAVVTMFDAGLHEGRVFIAMELVDGQSMSEWLDGCPPWRHGAAVLAAAARGLQAAHARGIVHRDFKPANVLLGRDGRVCVADFGLARQIARTDVAEWSTMESPVADTIRAMTRAGEVAGTPAYMAPEQYLGTVQDARSDQFAFCVSLYEALWGRRPFEGDTILELRDGILHGEPAVPRDHDVPDELVRAVVRGLSKRPEDRFDGIHELADLLEAVAGGVDLVSAFGDQPAGREAPPSMLAQYLGQLPDGLDTGADRELPSRCCQIALAKMPLVHLPEPLRATLAAAAANRSISAVQERAILSAIYDEHFDSLDMWREVVARLSQGVITLSFTGFALPPPSSTYFVEGLAAAYHGLVREVAMEIVEKAPWTAVVRLRHAPKTVDEVALVVLEEMLRAAILATGCRIADLTMLERTDDTVLLKLNWR
ncbi:MAG: serine/threonine-protein kinase [Polyangiaceae bacterium]